ncbi:unnamed protein product, partial [Gongylonema pulchrum]|uniref:PRUN2 protein n=1 Tax=Gongylonema pulchrum TaxID=637853 RepID=A0A183DAW7_9BILA
SETSESSDHDIYETTDANIVKDEQEWRAPVDPSHISEPDELLFQRELDLLELPTVSSSCESAPTLSPHITHIPRIVLENEEEKGVEVEELERQPEMKYV